MNIYNRQLATTVDLGERTASGRNRQNFLENDLKNQNNLNVNKNCLPGLISPHGVPTTPIAATNRSSIKQAQASATTRTRIEPQINYDESDDWLYNNHRDWRITMNKNYN